MAQPGLQGFHGLEEVSSLATSLLPLPSQEFQHAPGVEPSTDFPTLDLVPPLPEPSHPSRTMIGALLLAGTILIGTLGFAIGRSTAGPPAACERAIDLADRTATLAVADLRTVREGMLVFLDGETPEAYSILGDARLGVDELRALRTQLETAAEACLAS